jgi:hypothetical protein
MRVKVSSEISDEDSEPWRLDGELGMGEGVIERDRDSSKRDETDRVTGRFGCMIQYPDMCFGLLNLINEYSVR